MAEELPAARGPALQLRRRRHPGLAAVGCSAGRQHADGPFMVVYFGMGLVALPEAARILRRSPRLFRSSACCRRRPRHPGAGLGNRAPRGATERTRAPDTRKYLETDLSAGIAGHDTRNRLMSSYRRRHGPACAGSRAAKPERHAHRDDGERRPRHRGSRRWRGSLGHDRLCDRVVDGLVHHLAAIPRCDAEYGGKPAGTASRSTTSAEQRHCGG
jgi:hypothetical protein